MTKVKGFKVFNSDWTCDPTGHNPKQYTCPGKFEEEVELDVCNHGMHFCQNATDCFNYYSFNSNNKVAEVIAYGEVLIDGDISCTDKLEIVREIPWDEVLRIVNTGKNCTGRCNTGHRNTGDYNTGSWNTGFNNTDHHNAGDCNTGHYNTGDCNTGDYNTGNYNTGDYNTGRCNTGNYNTGDGNIGNYNTGDCNTGNWNKSSFNTGCFNTEEQKIMLFNKLSDMTYCEWMNSAARYLLDQMPKNVKWVYATNMTDEEKEQHPNFKVVRGYLKESCKQSGQSRQEWWNSLQDYEKKIIKDIPNFDADIFYECTGIKVR